jgi:cysteine desulfurase
MRIGNTIYLDHHATTVVDSQVLAKMLPYFMESFGNPHSVDHAFGWSSARAVEDAASKVAALIGSDADEVIFTSGATEANNLALFGLTGRSSDRKAILLSATDHKSSLAVGRVLEKRGFKVTIIRVGEDGLIDIEHLRTNLTERVLAVSINLVNSEIGTIQNLPEISTMVREHGAYLHCDAAQAPCAMDLRGVAQLTDLLSLSAHKMYGPKGVGALYIRRSLQDAIEPIVYGGGQQRNLRSGTLPTPLCVGFGAAAELLIGAHGEREIVRDLRETFLSELYRLPWPIALNGTARSRHPGNLNVQFAGFSAEDLIASLQPHLAASTGSACTTGTPEPSHVLRAIGLSYEKVVASMRFCVGRYTTEADILEATARIGTALDRLSGAGLRRAI